VVTGCLLLTSTSVWDELGGFDPDYFMYGEDVDLSRRAIDHGYRPSITPRAEAIHAVGTSSSSSEKMVMVMKGKATLNRKQRTAAARLVSAGLLMVGVSLRAGLERLTARPGAWTLAWRRRDEWRRGWPPLASDEVPCDDPQFVTSERWETAA
jgi:GT2 family glycosyltransferase